jgi:hypothetical protein
MSSYLPQLDYRSIETIYQYQNGNARFQVRMTTELGIRNSYDLITQKEDLSDTISNFLSSLNEEPLAMNEIQISICVYENIQDFSRIFLTSYVVDIKLIEVSFENGKSPLHILNYNEFNLDENVRYGKMTKYSARPKA